MHPEYRWITVEAGRHQFLRPVFSSLGASSIRILVEDVDPAVPFDRSQCGGLVLAVGECQGRAVAVAWSDFRVDGGCYNHANASRFTAFLRELGNDAGGGPPLFYVVNSAGVSLVQGRTLFADAFRLWPELLAYSREHVVVTCAVGKCLGLATLLFGLGHYRMAVMGRTHINLTGPEVLELFFGDRVDFARQAAAESSYDRNDLVHELVPSVEVAFERWKGLLGLGHESTPVTTEQDPVTIEFLGAFLDPGPQELVPGWCSTLRLFLGARRGRPIGIFINPLRRPENLITVRTLDKYAAGLDLFRALRVPIVSVLDSPGVDPRFEQSDANNIRRMLAVGEKIITYPHPFMGVIAGRCFGGASTLSMPKIFGGRRSLALRGSTFGVMQSSIIDRVLQQSPRLRELWRASEAEQVPGLEDLLGSGMLDAVIDLHELPDEIDRLLTEAAASASRRDGAPRVATSGPR